MWHIQTPVDGLLLPTDTEGRTRPTGHVPAWHHIVRLREAVHDKADSVLASAPLSWEIRPWHQIGNRLYLRDSTEFQDGLLQMMRSNAGCACTLATFPPHGKRASDNTIQLVIVTPPERFAQYETLVRFAMTLPDGSVSISLPTPWITELDGEGDDRFLLTPGYTSLLEEVEIAVSRAPIKPFTSRDLRLERRPLTAVSASITSSADDDSEWLVFRRDDSPAELAPTPRETATVDAANE
jgi:hypothetical protein